MNNKIKLLHEITKSPESDLKKGKIGKLIRATLPIIISENLITEIEIKNLLSDKYSKSIFDMNYPVLKIVNKDQSILENRMVKDHTRYYAGVIENSENQYLISSEWFDCSMQGFIQWLKRKVKVD